MEKTFVMIKPDGVKRKLIGEIIGRFEEKGFNIAAMKMLTPGRELFEQHYAVHKGKPFYEPLLDFITSGPVVAMVLEGENVIEIVRKMMGATDPLKAEPGSIRGDYSTSTQRNLIHGSDAAETAEFEIGLWFDDGEMG